MFKKEYAYIKYKPIFMLSLPIFSQENILLSFAFFGLVSFFESLAFAGLFFPGTTLILFAGYFCARQGISPFLAIIFITAGGLLGGAVSFFLGKIGATNLLERYHLLKPAQLHKGQKFLEKYGKYGVSIARFIGPLRPIVPFTAGLFKMSSKRFFISDILGVILSTIFYVLVGYYFG